MEIIKNWNWYNKVDTKLREDDERGLLMRKSYDKQFKIAAVKLVLEDDMSVSDAAKQLSIHYNSLYRWISEYEEYGESAFPGHGTALYSYQYEIKKLKQENLELKSKRQLKQAYVP